MVKTYCDKCGAEIKNGCPVNVTIEVPVDIFTVAMDRDKGYQLCKKCAAEVDDFINTKEAKA